MEDGNVLVAWIIANGTDEFSERYTYKSDFSGGAKVTTNQNWKLLYAAQKNGYLIVKFQRPIVLCGEKEQTTDVKKSLLF
jgi:hypothetical protein